MLSFKNVSLAIIACFGRNSEHSSTRQAVCLGPGGKYVGLALTGTYEFARGYARIWMNNR